MSWDLYPALDIRAGRVVRLRQGDYAQETRYDTDPLAQAMHYAEAGARWMHLVDLDAARAGGYTLIPLLRTIKAETGLAVQTGGGVRRETDLLRLIEAGADRVVVGSLAVQEPEQVAGWIARYGAGRITVALDTRRDASGRWQLPVHGWTQSEAGGRTLDTLAAAYAGIGLKHLLCTDIARDGMLAGPNLALYAHLRALAPTLAVQASGGVRDLADLRAVQACGCAGAVLGKALLDGRFDLTDALREAAVC
ncbi:HisA/HisF-related TIM barrel protein [Rehaibacterium terrae]|jgi:phosphoribosylformimino-5-aminoimidazole carboxamide ribotide isomerase|uniref:1-(5-phosphoribosyl)-5-[(5-phosphoribosylamino)methylideneamino] imidazole-4-carboxamide isomerase n=1 Tax=Rehaibacterium terrae TaxID=1341696 RepID=A0A7W7V6R4_9GAMM|nr:1-(5-phosphoribosyl)-5-[(5-phosphoribosylamino)methylideneamino] imidazole-4-carboxamide isomerase [Rehaibacterium terrae]MBB5014277.1 phosphoribosylformimino-5-aminoimidazole carboxamide ribotide isomerase [Rehaibacterium terrae]